MFSQRSLCNGKEVGIGACKMWSYKAAIRVSSPRRRRGIEAGEGARDDLFVSKVRSIPQLRVGFKFRTLGPLFVLLSYLMRYLFIT